MTDLQKALITIRDECEKHDDCYACPLRTKTLYEQWTCVMYKVADMPCDVTDDVVRAVGEQEVAE